MPVTPEPPRRGHWITANRGNIYYRPRPKSKKQSVSTPRFPRPLIEPRRTRPQAIHIVTYPPGYVPHELRPKPESSRARKIKVRAARAGARRPEGKRHSGAASASAPAGTSASAAPASAPSDSVDRLPIHPVSVIGKLLGSFSATNSHIASRRLSILSIGSANSSSHSASAASASIESITADRPSAPTEATGVLPTTTTTTTATACTATAATHYESSNPRRYSLTGPAADAADSDVIRPAADSSIVGHYPPPLGGIDSDPPHLSDQDLQLLGLGDLSHLTATATEPSHLFTSSPLLSSVHQQPLMRASSDTAALNPQRRPPLRNSFVNSSKRNSFMSVRSAKSSLSSLVTEVPKPVVTGSGVACSIILAEPNLFLSGFDHDGHNRREGQSGTALLRGKLQLNVTKNVKLKAVQLKLIGRARTEWPEGIPPLKQDLFEEQGLRTQVLTFFNAMNNGWETEFGNQCTYKLKNSPTPNGSATYLVVAPGLQADSATRGYSSRELKRLSLQSAQSRSFGKGDSPVSTPTQVKGFKIFYPGTYDYSFELPIDHHQLETIKLQYGSVRWELHATVDRAGAFKPNLHGMKEVSIVRVPDQMSLEMTEPISISRQWEDQLHYDIIISGKSFPIGSKIPIAFKLTPLAKVQVHKLKVFLTESIEYWTNDRRVTRKDPGRKILLLEKSAGKPLDAAWSTSELRTVRGGELTAHRRREAREIAAVRRTHDAARRGDTPDALPEPTENILGDLDLGLECLWGSTEIEANVQIPTCEMMAKNKELKLHPDCSWKNVNVYHWIKVVMRISRLDPEDPTGTKRRHFEISIDSPFTVLNCKATQANTNLPAYTGDSTQGSMYQSSCGCPDAHTVRTDVSPSSSTGTLPVTDRSTENLPSLPQAAHLANGVANPASESQPSPVTQADPRGPRPIHLLRAPSFNPPGFEEDSAPPPMTPILVGDESESADMMAQTPPPQYDIVVGTPSVDGLADYFSRLADYGFDEHDSGSDDDASPPRILDRTGRVNVAHPHTPGGRMPSRSMEISRPAPQLRMPRLPNRTPAAATAGGD
jgi:hypothetical protein